jgi:hypothetical protein
MSYVGAQLKDLSRQFAEGSSDPEALAQAERAADAQLELARIWSLKTSMIEHALSFGAPRRRTF